MPTNVKSSWNSGELLTTRASGASTFVLPFKWSDAWASETISINTTLAATDSGKIIYVDTDTVVLTLPSTAVGITFTIINGSVSDGTVGINISPAAADKIQGIDISAADNKDLINTKTTAKPGDMVTLVGDGADGWFITHMIGTWAREA